jgi:hypothetical protein
MFTLPASKGMTRYKTVKIFKEALKDGDKHRVQRTWIDALRNHLPAASLLETAKASVKSDITMDNKQIARQLFHEVRSLPSSEELTALGLYKEQGILTPEILEQYQKIKAEWEETEKHRNILNIKEQ